MKDKVSVESFWYYIPDGSAPTPTASSVELFVAFIAVENCWELRQLDVKQAFIQAGFDSIFFIKLPDDVL